MPNNSTDRFPEPKIAEAFLEKKVNVPTDKWDDLKWGEHAYAFTVAHSAEAGVLDTIHGYLNDCIKSGKSFDDFRNSMLDYMKKSGWYGGVGYDSENKKYQNWRIGVMYDTNMRTAYSAEHYRKQLDAASTRPVWQYHHSPFVKKARPDHLALDGKCYRYDDPFWDTYYPPNGWGCKCYVTTMSEGQAQRQGIDVGDSANDSLPAIDQTWAYNVGQASLAPNFKNFDGLRSLTATVDGKKTNGLRAVRNQYEKVMSETKMTNGEFKWLLGHIAEDDQNIKHINYQVGSVSGGRADALYADGIPDCKIMGTDYQLWHGTADKTIEYKVKNLDDLYDALQEPDAIYFEKERTDIEDDKQPPYWVYHFVKNLKNDEKIRVLLHINKVIKKSTALQFITAGQFNYEYEKPEYEKLWSVAR
jgi:SPP1 gp7 family putative phage head morphogenesis protein